MGETLHRRDGSSQASAASMPPDEQQALRALVEGTAAATGEEFFQRLVRHLSAAVDAQHAFVSEFLGDWRARTLSYWSRDRLAANVEWDVRGTPCEDVVRGELCHHPRGVRTRFPDDEPMVQMGIESYLGVPLRDADGTHLGHLAVFDPRPMPQEPRRLDIFNIFAARAAAELRRLRAEQRLAESEQAYRDLYDEAPIAYVSTGIDGRFRAANRKACELLGYSHDELIGSEMLSHMADTPAGKERARATFAEFLDGKEIRGRELELVRRDGSPLWISLWTRPMRDSAGHIRFSRSMWLDITDRVLMQREKSRLEQQNQYLREEIASVHNFQEIVGFSPRLVSVLQGVEQVAPTETSVLITGETGTGKELIARAIHSRSRRAGGPLIKVNCAALPAGLVESELFGHERGAFSGAVARRSGRFELAQGGTIFLDEIGEIPLDVQAKLLRVLQEREFERVGGSATIHVDVRIIAATNRDLRKSVEAKTFRDDLYYRLSVFPVHLPPLRERAEDVPLLVQFLLGKFAARLGKRIDGVTAQTMQRLCAYDWPGNIRELENVLERAAVLAKGPMLEIEPEVLAIDPSHRSPSSSLATMEAAEREHLLAALNRTRWVIDGARGAARLLDIHPNTLRSRLKKLGITRPSHERS